MARGVEVTLQPPSSLLAELTAQELRALRAGEVPTRMESHSNRGRGWGAILIERPVREVWATLARWDDRAEYVPRLERLEVLATEPGRALVRQWADASIRTVITTCWYELDEAGSSIRWKLDETAPDNTPADVEGDYRMAELEPGRSLLVYRAHVDTGMRIPRAVQAFMQRRAIPDLLGAVKKRVESGGRWKK
jgi:hypothetical protein